VIDTRLFLNTLLHIMPVLYGIAFFDYILLFASDDRVARRLARPLLLTALGVNAIYFLVYTAFYQHVPLVTVYQVLGAIGLALTATYVWVESRTKTQYTGPFILFLVLVFQIVAAEFPNLDPKVPDLLRNGMFSLHVMAAVLGYSAFAVAAVYGLLYLLLYRNMRNKRFGLVFRRLPPLETLDAMNFHASIAGFGFLSLAVVMGFLWSLRVIHPWHLDPKITVAVATLVVYGAAIAGRQFGTWRGSKLAYSSLFGFLAVLFSMFGVNFFFTRFHEFLG